jgi:hypothetical protein
MCLAMRVRVRRLAIGTCEAPRHFHKPLIKKKELPCDYYEFLMLRPGRCNAKRFMVPQMMPGGHRTKKMETSQ